MIAFIGGGHLCLRKIGGQQTVGVFRIASTFDIVRDPGQL